MPRTNIFRRLILSVVIMLVMLTGCSTILTSEGNELDSLLTVPNQNTYSNSLQSEQEKTVLRLWSFHQSKEYEFWEQLAEAYQSVNPNVEIQVEYISSDIYFNSSRLMSFFASGNGPDIFFVSPGTINRFSNAQVIQPLTNRFTPEIRDDFYTSALEAVTVEGEIYAIPIETELLGLYYNKETFAEKGLEPPKTWNEMLEAASILKTDQMSGLTMETFSSVYQVFTWLPFIWQTGADFEIESGSYKAVDPDKMSQMYHFFRQIMDKSLINLNPSRPTNDIGILAEGETVMQVTGSWNIANLESIYKDKPIGVVPLPTPEGGESLTIAGGWQIAANRLSEHSEAAADFIMWAFAGEPEIPLLWCNETKFAYSPRKSVMEAAGDDYLKGLREVFTTQIFGTERQEPRFPQELNTIISDSLQQLLHSNTPVEQIVLNQITLMDEFLLNNKK